MALNHNLWEVFYHKWRHIVKELNIAAGPRWIGFRTTIFSPALFSLDIPPLQDIFDGMGVCVVMKRDETHFPIAHLPYGA